MDAVDINIAMENKLPSKDAQSCEFFEKDPLLQCKAFHDGYLVPNEQDMQQYCLEHPKQCSHYQKVQVKAEQA